jgi:hypothetical protein
MKKQLNIEITELFMAKAGRGITSWKKCFTGTIRRTTDADGNPVVYGKIKVNNGIIYATAKDQMELGKKLDEMVLQVLNTKYEEESCAMAINRNIKFDKKSIFLN